jgi:hypothetical protein
MVHGGGHCSGGGGYSGGGGFSSNVYTTNYFSSPEEIAMVTATIMFVHVASHVASLSLVFL